MRAVVEIDEDQLLRDLTEDVGVDLGGEWIDGAITDPMKPDKAVLPSGSRDEPFRSGLHRIGIEPDRAVRFELFVNDSAVAGDSIAMTSGSAAPRANVPAEDIAACTGRAPRVSEMPSSSRACAARASCSISCDATFVARSGCRPRST